MGGLIDGWDGMGWMAKISNKYHRKSLLAWTFYLKQYPLVEAVSSNKTLTGSSNKPFFCVQHFKTGMRDSVAAVARNYRQYNFCFKTICLYSVRRLAASIGGFTQHF